MYEIAIELKENEYHLEIELRDPQTVVGVIISGCNNGMIIIPPRREWVHL